MNQSLNYILNFETYAIYAKMKILNNANIYNVAYAVCVYKH